MAVSVDFDGVICQSLPWRPDQDIMSEPPVPGAIEALRYLMSKYAVFILTARNVNEVIPWLESYGFETDRDNGDPTWNLRGMLLVTNRKLPALIYVDDRGLRFVSWEQALPQIEEYAI